jgi:hypothetical protein
MVIQSANSLCDSFGKSTLELLIQIKNQIQEYIAERFVEDFDPETETRISTIDEMLSLSIDKVRTYRKNVQKSIEQHNLIKVNLDAYLSNKIAGEQLSVLCNKLKSAHDIHEYERKKEIDSLLASLSGDIDSLYNVLHPDERIGTIILYLKENARASLELGANFESETNIPPHAYYSESHIDTLGICIFLALAKFNQSEVVVLDDVLTSVDSQHLSRFIDMLSIIAPDFDQIIVTTHYRTWRERYRTGRGALSNTQVIELGQWTLTNGIRTRAFTTELELLKRELLKNGFDRQVIASKAGVILESILDFLTLTYHLKVRRNHRHEYSLGDLADSFDRNISEALKIQRRHEENTSEDTMIAPLVMAATRLPWVRNCVGCHFQVLGSEVADTEVLEFGNSVMKLANVLMCPTCSTLPIKKVAGSYWECKCQNGSMIMKPLEHP